MIERGITDAEIDDVLANPAVTAPSRDAPGHRVVVRGKTSQGRRLMIVVATDDPEFVITAASPDEE
jgi:hypothetical protein